MLETARMKKNLLLLVLVSLFTNVWAQEEGKTKTKPSTPSPDFPGEIVIEYGLNYLTNNSHEMRTNPWKSMTLNVYFVYDFRIAKSRFSFRPGIGVGSEKYGFESPVSFLDSANKTWLEPVANLARFENMTSLEKTQFITNYVDIPLEFRVHSRKDDPKRSWFLAVGGKFGFNFDAKTKIRYTELGSRKKYKDKYDFNVNSFRYGFTARIGYGPFNVWYYYSASMLFQGNKAANMDNPNMWSFGISLASF